MTISGSVLYNSQLALGEGQGGALTVIDYRELKREISIIIESFSRDNQSWVGLTESRCLLFLASFD